MSAGYQWLPASSETPAELLNDLRSAVSCGRVPPMVGYCNCKSTATLVD
jgi:hypothetical protein